jgi:hypothetical protein
MPRAYKNLKLQIIKLDRRRTLHAMVVINVIVVEPS